MKNTLNNTLIIILTIALTYLMFAFVLWDLNASHWNEGTRVLFICIAIMFGCCAAVAININKL